MIKLKHRPAISRFQKAVFIVVVLPILLLYILPNLFMAGTYFLIPGDTLPRFGARLPGWVNNDQEVCVITYLTGTSVTVIPALRAKFIVDGQIVPFWNLEIRGYRDPFDPTFEEDIVCMKPDLTPGAHEIRVVRRNWTDTHSITLPFQVTENGSVIPN